MQDEFVDFYELMQISPNAEPATIVRVYRMLASRYHPDNPETGEMQIFLRLNDAYKVLSDPQARAEYDLQWQQRHSQPIPEFTRREFNPGVDGETNRRLGLLTLLYSKRRSNPESPGLSVLDLESAMSTPREHLLFTLWYLKEKEFLAQSDNSDYVITHIGVDYVEQHIDRHETLRRLLRAPGDTDSGADRDPNLPDP